MRPEDKQGSTAQANLDILNIMEIVGERDMIDH